MKLAAAQRWQRVAIYLTPADLNWLEEVRNAIRAITGKRAPALATLLSSLVQAIRQDDQALVAAAPPRSPH